MNETNAQTPNENTRQSLRSRILPSIAQQVRNVERGAAISFTVFIAFVVPANGQEFNQFGEALCATNVITPVLFGIAGFALYLLMRSLLTFMAASENYNSPNQEEHREGVAQIKSGTATFAGMFVPVIFGAVIGLMGINTPGCLDFDIGIIGFVLALI